MGGERICDERAVARLEDVERQRNAWEEDDVRQRKERDEGQRGRRDALPSS